MQALKQSSTAKPLVFAMWDSTDPSTPKTGLTVTVTISKNGGSFASPSGAVSEIGNGLYRVAGNATDTNTLGTLALYATATGAKPTLMAYSVVAYDPDDAAALGLSRLDIATSAVWTAGTRTLTAQSDSSGVTTLLSRVVGTLATGTHNPQSGDTYARIGAAGAGLTALGDTRLNNLDATISSRLASVSYTAPPAASAVAVAVVSQSLAGYTTAGTVGAALTASAAQGDPWATLVPGSYSDGTAGSALGRLNILPASNPVALAPAPASDPDLALLYLDTESLTGQVLIGLSITVDLLRTPSITADKRHVGAIQKTMTADPDTLGRYTLAIQTGLSYLVSNRTLFGSAGKKITIPADATVLNIADL